MCKGNKAESIDDSPAAAKAIHTALAAAGGRLSIICKLPIADTPLCEFFFHFLVMFMSIRWIYSIETSTFCLFTIKAIKKKDTTLA